MITIFCALYAEASPLLRRYGLKKVRAPLKFDIFQNEDESLRLVLTGSGAIAAAAAAGSVYTLFPPKAEDGLLNFGTCGGTEEKGTLLLMNRLVSSATSRAFYPDMTVSAGIPEGSLTTVPVPAKELSPGQHTDMEAAAVYEAASLFLGPHQMAFLKVVSDHGAGRRFSSEEIAALVESRMDETEKFLSEFSFTLTARQSDAPEEELFSSLKQQLHCSDTMEAALRQDLRYAALTGQDAEKLLSDFHAQGLLPCSGKTEGKQVLEALHARLLQ